MPANESPTKRSIPRSRMKAAAIASGVVSLVSGVAVGVAEIERPGTTGLGLLSIAVFTTMIFGAMFLMILFVLLQMQSGIEWNKRGGKPNPFTRDGT